MKLSLVLLAVCLLPSLPAFAQATPATVTAPSSPNVLTIDELKELSNARLAAIKANPNLQLEVKNLHDKIVAAKASGSSLDSEALKTQAVALEDEVRAAMVKIDPGVVPILAKIEAIRAQQKAMSASPSGN